MKVEVLGPNTLRLEMCIESFMLEGIEREIGANTLSEIKNYYDLKLSVQGNRTGVFYSIMLEATEGLNSNNYQKFEIQGLPEAPYIYECINFMKMIALRYFETNPGKVEEPMLTRMSFSEPIQSEQTLPTPKYWIDKGFKESNNLCDPMSTWFLNKDLTKMSKLIDNSKALEICDSVEWDEYVIIEIDIKGGVINNVILMEQDDPDTKVIFEGKENKLGCYILEAKLIIEDLKRQGKM